MNIRKFFITIILALPEKQILRSPPPNCKTFGGPFVQNDTLNFYMRFSSAATILPVS